MNVHLNFGQNMTINTSSVFFSIETLSMASLRNKVIELVDGAQIHFPSNFSLTINDSGKILVRVSSLKILFTENVHILLLS